MNVSLVGTFEFASAASHSTVHLINVIAPVIASNSDISPTNSRPKKIRILGKRATDRASKLNVLSERFKGHETKI